MFKFPFIKQDDVKSYKIMELEAKESKLKDELIEELRARIHDLEVLVDYLKIGTPTTGEIVYPQTSYHQEVKTKPRVRTMSEVSLILEERSRRKIGEGKGAKSAEDISSNS